MAVATVLACGGRTGLVVDEPTPDAAPNDAGRDALDASEIGVDAPVDAPFDGVVDGTPRLLSPLSTSTVRTRTPTLRWKNPPGTSKADVFVCTTYDCSKTIVEAVVDGESIDVALDPGTYFWNVRWGLAASATWELFVPKTRGAGVDTSWGSMLDLNADGFADVVLREDKGLQIHLGAAAGPSATSSTVDAFAFYSVLDTLTSAGDLDGDGFPELVVKGTTSKEGVVQVFRGARTGFASAAIVILPPDAPTEPALFPSTVVAIGDIDADGYGDLVLTNQAALDGLGHVYVYRGSKDGVATTPSVVLSGRDGLDEGFGYGAGAIDVDGDGKLELLVQTAKGRTASTLVYDLPSTTPSVEIEDFGYLGDFNCDGFGDVVTAPAGKLVVHAGSVSGLTAPITLAISVGTSRAVPWAVGDFDGDGCDDAVVLDTDVVAGALSVLRGDPSSFLVPGRALGLRPVAFEAFGVVVPIGDVDGDGRWDIAFSAKDNSFEGHLGATTGISTTPLFDFPGYNVASSD